jgi:threonine/homoserine/homoserine lactone efflux protein
MAGGFFIAVFCSTLVFSMPLLIVLKGVCIGFLISVPTGPVGFLCMRRALMHHYRASFSSALGSIGGDVLFGAIAIFGLTSIHSFFIKEQLPITFFGGLLLLYVGIKTFFATAPDTFPGLQKYEHVGNFASTFLLTMTNPIQIMTLPIVFTAIGTGVPTGAYGWAGVFLFGLLVGACLCWIFLIGIATLFKKYIKEHHFKIINYISGGLITGVGIFVLLKLIIK